jgi:hypothetical protein
MKIKTLSKKLGQHAFLCLFLLASLTYLIIKLQSSFAIGGSESGNDSLYYHGLATGVYDKSVNLWGDILLFLGNSGYYNRGLVSFFLYVLYLFISFFAPRLSLIGCLQYSSTAREVMRWRWMCSLAFLSYPSLFAFTLDLYRDVFMLSVFLVAQVIACLFYFKTKLLAKLLLAALYIGLCIILFRLRPYLGLSALLPIFIRYSLNGKKLYVAVLFSISLLLLLYSFGLLDPLILYRGENGFSTGGSTLGITFLGLNPFTFLNNLIASFSLQVFGLYLTSPLAFFVFCVETLPFSFALFFIVRNRIHMDRFCLHLFAFACIYSVLFSIGNDNLGTAVRLRLPVYASAYIIALRILAFRHMIRKQGALFNERLDLAPPPNNTLPTS